MLWTIMLVSLLLGVLLAGYVVLSESRRRRTPPELRGDWWQRFEREFRAYAASGAHQSANARGRNERQRGNPRTPPR